MVLLALILSPYLMNKNGIGTRANDTNANKLLPHPSPKAAYIFWLLSGTNAAIKLRRTVFAAMALAACVVNTSIKYVLAGMNVMSSPKPMMPVPNSGTM